MRQEHASRRYVEPGDEQTEATKVTASPASKRSPLRFMRDPLVVLVFALAFAADQITKAIVLSTMRLGESHNIFGIVNLTFVRNTGAAFGFFQDHSTLITIASIIAVAAIVFAYRHAAMVSPLTRAALGLQVGGALGNVVDRFRHGYVVDFIDVGSWPVFNIADSAVVSGILVLVVYFTLIHDHEGDPEYRGKGRRSGSYNRGGELGQEQPGASGDDQSDAANRD